MSNVTGTLDVEKIKESSKLFQMLDEAGQLALLELGIREKFPHDAVLFEEGKTGDTFYIVETGTLRVLIDKGDRNAEVAKLGPGACVGEIAALMREERSATVVAEGELDAIRFDAEPVQQLLSDYPKVRESLVKEALERSEENLQELLRVTDETALHSDESES
jgi:CRP-like cAMP-binding protein